MRARVVLATMALAASSILATPALATNQPTVEVYGDSMQSQAYPYIWFDVQQMSSPPKLIEHAWPGFAVCDFLTQMQKDATTIHPEAVLLLFVGNKSTSCISSAANTSDAAVAAQYAKDVTTAVNIFLANGTKYIYVFAGPTEPQPLEGYAGPVRLAEAAAIKTLKSPRVKWIDAGASVDAPSTGAFTLTRSCVPYEVNRHLCKGPVLNRLRTNYVRITDGHFCTWPWPRGTFCAGAWRFGNAEVTALMNGFHWSPLPPTGSTGLQ